MSKPSKTRSTTAASILNPVSGRVCLTRPIPAKSHPWSGWMGSIPHGTTINLQGQAFSVPVPHFAVSSITPFEAGSPDDGATKLVHFPEEILTNASTSRTDLARVVGLTQDQLSNPNLFLSQAIADQTVLSTTVLSVASDTSIVPAGPDAGGGTDNIAFLIGKGASPAGGSAIPSFFRGVKMQLEVDASLRQLSHDKS